LWGTCPAGSAKNRYHLGRCNTWPGTNVTPAEAQHGVASDDRVVVSARVAPQALRRMGDPAVQLHDQEPRVVVNIVVAAPAGRSPARLPPAGWQPVGSLDKAEVSLLQYRVASSANGLDRLGELVSPAHLRPAFHCGVQAGGSGQATRARAGQTSRRPGRSCQHAQRDRWRFPRSGSAAVTDSDGVLGLRNADGGARSPAAGRSTDHAGR